MNTATMKNWSVTTNQNGFIPPELLQYILQGNIYDDSREYFPDGSQVHTSAIKNIEDRETYKVVITSRTEYKVFPYDVDPEYEKAYPNAYERLSIMLSGTDGKEPQA